MTIQDLARNKLAYLNERKSELNLPEEEFTQKINWLQSLLENESSASENIQQNKNTSDEQGNEYFVSVDLSKLRKIIDDTHNLDELRTLCFDLDVEYENLGGEAKEAKISNFILMAKRQNKINKLISVLIQQQRIVLDDLI